MTSTFRKSSKNSTMFKIATIFLILITSFATHGNQGSASLNREMNAQYPFDTSSCVNPERNFLSRFSQINLQDIEVNCLFVVPYGHSKVPIRTNDIIEIGSFGGLTSIDQFKLYRAVRLFKSGKILVSAIDVYGNDSSQQILVDSVGYTGRNLIRAVQVPNEMVSAEVSCIFHAATGSNSVYVILNPTQRVYYWMEFENGARMRFTDSRSINFKSCDPRDRTNKPYFFSVKK